MASDDVIERLARVLMDEALGNPPGLPARSPTQAAKDLITLMAQRGLSLHVTETHVAVPREPDDERAVRGTEACDGAISIPEAKRVYRAMTRTEGEG